MALNNTQYDTLMRDYQLLQTRHRHEQSDRIHEVFEKYPRLEEIDREVASRSVAYARKLLSGDKNALILLKSDIRLLSEERRHILHSAGYPDDYLELHYTCPDCKDTGFISNTKCRCFKKAAIDLLYTQSNLTDILNEENFSTLSYDYHSDKIFDESGKITSLANFQKAVQVSREFVQRFDTSFENLLFYGNSGLGKTFLSHCIAKELLESVHSVIYFSARGLFQSLADERFHNSDGVSQITDQICSCDLLVIDDLGTELTNSFVISEFFYCLNERLNNKKSTLISTNLPLKDLRERYSDRISSRIFNSYRAVKFFGNDIRIQKKLLENARKDGKY